MPRDRQPFPETRKALDALADHVAVVHADVRAARVQLALLTVVVGLLVYRVIRDGAA